jgi:16S rRNA (guanine966-N2)-methyltransferase
MRIIAGTHRSRLLKSLKGPNLRPTSDYVRETLFNILGPSVANSHFLDVFAGTGAVGIEALSRGATHATFIENHVPAAKLIRENLESLDLEENATIFPIDAHKALEKLATRRDPHPPFDFIYIDPPYANTRRYDSILDFLGSQTAVQTILSPAVQVIAEHRRTFAPPEAQGLLRRTRALRQGDTTLTFYRL